MSYDIRIEATRTTTVYESAITINLVCMLKECMCISLKELSGMPCAEAQPYVEAGLRQLCQRPEEYEKYQPSTWWAHDWLFRLLTSIKLNPDGIVHVN